jgi:hypothetical protein
MLVCPSKRRRVAGAFLFKKVRHARRADGHDVQDRESRTAAVILSQRCLAAAILPAASAPL